jgi:hypothetical protein
VVAFNCNKESNKKKKRLGVTSEKNGVIAKQLLYSTIKIGVVTKQLLQSTKNRCNQSVITVISKNNIVTLA